jgi:histidine triad (HIT) family protein
MSTCPFCDIVAGHRGDELLYADDTVAAFLCNPPATSGHTLIVPRAHRADVWEIEPPELSAATELARRLSAVMRERLGAIGVNLRQNSGERSGQDVFHFHLHVVPRYENDTVQPGCVWGAPPWEPPRNDAAERRRLTAILSAGLA